jgi:hypothetical protein
MMFRIISEFRQESDELTPASLALKKQYDVDMLPALPVMRVGENSENRSWCHRQNSNIKGV